MSAGRLLCRESNVPLLMNDSMTRRFTALKSTRSQKSKSDLKGPSFFRASRIDSTAPSPTFLIAASPKRMSFSPTTVKNMSEALTSGGRTWRPISFAEPMYSTIFSVFARSDVSSAAMKNAGKFALR
jgi:hypothetical protein